MHRTLMVINLFSDKYKMTGECVLSEQHSATMSADLSFNDAVLYPNPYITVTPNGYTKHYFMGKERIATAIGGGGFCNMTYPTDKLDTSEEDLLLNIIEKLSFSPWAASIVPQA